MALINSFYILSEKRRTAKHQDETFILQKLIEHKSFDEFTSIYLTKVYQSVSGYA